MSADILLDLPITLRIMLGQLSSNNNLLGWYLKIDMVKCAVIFVLTWIRTAMLVVGLFWDRLA